MNWFVGFASVKALGGAGWVSLGWVSPDKPPHGTRTRSRTASGSRVGRDKASTAPSEAGRAGRRPGRPGPPSAGATSFLEGGDRK